jgi:hypothetical protein
MKDLKPDAWVFEVRGTGEFGLPVSGWRVYGVYDTERAAASGLRVCNRGLEGRVVPLFRQPLCPRPAAGRPENFLAMECVAAGECGCDHGADLSRALRIADDAAQSVVCTEGQPLEHGHWKLTSEQVEADPYLRDAFDHLEWRGIAEVRRADDGVTVVFK